MTFTILTLFPDILEAYFRASLMDKAVAKGLVQYQLVNIRDYAQDKHRTCDDLPYGGGAGMVLKPEPLARALEAVAAREKHVVYPSPSGALLRQDRVRAWSHLPDLVLICGRYEGVDQRVLDEYVDEEVSLGDYVLSSGEVASLVVVDAVYRLIEGVINGDSLVEESFEQDGLLEYPQYTRPEEFLGRRVPDVLLSGHHRKIQEWRLAQRIDRTQRIRPDLWEARRRGGDHGSDQGR